jgi:hypothetical protein
MLQQAAAIYLGRITYSALFGSKKRHLYAQVPLPPSFALLTSTLMVFEKKIRYTRARSGLKPWAIPTGRPLTQAH